ncbi:hypothetical protein HMSSN036_15340 [Paenibacillus macerans]|nr:hypothetical protein HMSSN036_15340 [Paenibacillus macerans]
MSRLRRKTKQLICAGLAGAAAMGLIFAGYAVHQGKQNQSARLALKQKYETEIERLRKEANRATVRGWVPVSEIRAGHPIKADDMKEVELPADSIPADALKSREDIAGKIAKITLRPFTLLTETLLYKEAPTTDDCAGGK